MAYCNSVFPEVSSSNTNSENEKWITENYFTEDYIYWGVSCSYFMTGRGELASSSVFSGTLYLKTWGEFTQIEMLTFCQMDENIKGWMFSVSVQHLLGRRRALFRKTLIAVTLVFLCNVSTWLHFRKECGKSFKLVWNRQFYSLT